MLRVGPQARRAPFAGRLQGQSLRVFSVFVVRFLVRLHREDP